MAQSSVSMKLLIDNKAKRVLFAEAGKDCVDFLFYILSLPVAKLVSLLGNQRMVGSLPNLYSSIENLNDSYIQPNQTKSTLLKPVSPVMGSNCVPLLAIEDASAENKLYRCSICRPSSYFSDDPSAVCPHCCNKMGKLVQQVASDEGGFVKGVVTYMVTDDLVVTPLSTISSITLLNKFNVKDVSALEEKVVNLGMTEAIKLLKASLETKKVLTRVFLNS